MSQRVKRVLNAFLLGLLGSLLALAIENWANLSNAVAVGDWISLKNLALSVGFGALLAGLRAIQAYLAIVPSPEPEENPPPSA
jgi:TRAP-type C4-dicarboxylate transport system permease small subunit